MSRLFAQSDTSREDSQHTSESAGMAGFATGIVALLGPILLLSYGIRMMQGTTTQEDIESFKTYLLWSGICFVLAGIFGVLSVMTLSLTQTLLQYLKTHDKERTIAVIIIRLTITPVIMSVHFLSPMAAIVIASQLQFANLYLGKVAIIIASVQIALDCVCIGFAFCCCCFCGACYICCATLAAALKEDEGNAYSDDV